MEQDNKAEDEVKWKLMIEHHPEEGDRILFFDINNQSFCWPGRFRGLVKDADECIIYVPTYYEISGAYIVAMTYHIYWQHIPNPVDPIGAWKKYLIK